jgi:SAM-dependent methyltransferase
MSSKEIYDEVNQRYGAIAQAGDQGGQYAQKVAKAFGYTEEQLASVPDGANLGLSCGNPTALANLSEGETVVDLGSGAGLDVFFAAKKVGRNGMSIGIDRNKDMLKKANANAAKGNVTNVRFIESPITKIALKDEVADCVISNCVINLVPAEDKQLAFDEMFRILKPGGRIAISDILARKPLPESMTKSIALHVGCIAGASQVSEYDSYLKDAGFDDILIVDSKSDLNVYFTASEHGKQETCCSSEQRETSQCCPPDTSAAPSNECCASDKKEACCLPTPAESSLATMAKELTKDMGDIDWNEWVGSFQIYALKAKSE